jgi:hypothetical protein
MMLPLAAVLVSLGTPLALAGTDDTAAQKEQ